jgi:hypothetical protein
MQKRLNYTLNDLEVAIREVRNGNLSMYRASKQFNIPKSTIQWNVHGKNTTNRLGAATLLTAEEETELEVFISTCADRGYSLNRELILFEANKFLKERKPEAKELGRKWFDNFLKRHPHSQQIRKAGFRVTGIHPLNAPEDRPPLIQPDPVVHDKRSVVDLIHEKRIQLLNQSMKAIEDLSKHLENGQNEFALNVSTIKKELEFINSSLEQSPAPRFIPRSLPSVQKSSSSSKPLVEKNSDFVDHQSKCRCCFKALKSQRKAIGITEDMRRQFLEITQTEVRLS